METNIIGAAATAECGENPLLTYAFISVLVASVKLQMCTQLFCGQTTHRLWYTGNDPSWEVRARH